ADALLIALPCSAFSAEIPTVVSVSNTIHTVSARRKTAAGVGAANGNVMLRLSPLRLSTARTAPPASCATVSCGGDGGAAGGAATGGGPACCAVGGGGLAGGLCGGAACGGAAGAACGCDCGCACAGVGRGCSAAGGG